MNKYELKYVLESQTSILDRLSDTAGKQSLHIQELWEQNKEKDPKYKSSLIRSTNYTSIKSRTKRLESLFTERIDIHADKKKISILLIPPLH